ncbi:MAG: hypothetical protein QXK89_06010 [Candidatus Bathyarchaeia archaeon]|nr:hypothetical protein [Candidatus Bathyarchaeota archaeon]
MLSRFEIWVLPHNLRAAFEKASILLRRAEFDVLYLNIQRGLQELVEDLALGAPYEQFINRVEEADILHEPITSWEYAVKPILLAIRGLKLKKPHLKIICYRNPVLDSLSIESAERIAMLTFRVNSTGKVDVEEWRSLIRKIIDGTDASIKDEVEYIIGSCSEVSSEQKAICMTDFSGRHLLRELRKTGIDVILRYIFLPYYFTPLEILLRETAYMLRRGVNIGNERLHKLVKLHAKFIREYILTSVDYDEAYFRWLRDKGFRKLQNGQ